MDSNCRLDHLCQRLMSWLAGVYGLLTALLVFVVSRRTRNNGRICDVASFKFTSTSTSDVIFPLNATTPNNMFTSEQAEISLTITGDPIQVWASIDSYHKCNYQIDVPDIPTRAYAIKGSNNSPSKIRMIQGSTNFHPMTGPSLFNVTRSCDVYWNKTANPDPVMYAANEFLDSTFAFGNETVISLCHTEYPGNRYDNCPTGPKSYPYCWTVSVGLMISYDYGTTWQHARPPPQHLVAAVPYQYIASQRASGWGDPTNIVYHHEDGYYYVAMWNRNPVGLQPPGICMMRTQSLLEPSSWRGWNGSHFSVSFASPYNNRLVDKEEAWNVSDHICTVLDVEESTLDQTQCSPFGLVWSSELKVFLMTWGCLSGYGSFYMTTSSDLIHWSLNPPHPFYNASLLPPDVSKLVTSLHYPSIMDATAPATFADNNYFTIGNNPHLFWVSFGHNVYLDGSSVFATPIRIQRGKDEIIAPMEK